MANSLSSVRDGSEMAYAAQAVLDEGTLGGIREANESFLVVIGACAAEPGGPAALGLPVPVAARVRELGAAERARVADCPYALFNLRFEDPQFWRSLLPGRLPPSPEPPARLAFARTAVFLAWHLAHSNELAAALVLGMSAEVQRAWRAIPLSVLDSASHIVLPHLSARWGAHPTFWIRLLAGGGADASAEESIRLLGLQLLAADGAWPTARTLAGGPGAP